MFSLIKTGAFDGFQFFLLLTLNLKFSPKTSVQINYTYVQEKMVRL